MGLLARVRAVIQSVVVQSGEDVLLPDREDNVSPTPRKDFPVIQAGSWPADLSLRRKDIHDEWGR